ncbi:MAG: type 3 dihydrofolate reductase [Gammaproteobacteria bacterium]|nr:type 3 dihydrofolate reductase [Gammaproteobacteria bacterium]
MISIVVAVSKNHVIGSRGELPWRLSDDLKHFKALTIGKPIIMGRKTYESIGQPLPDRQNIVITRQTDYFAEGCDVVASVDSAIAAAGDADELMVIGGGDIYRLFLPLAKRIYMTRVQAEVAGDAYFPVLDAGEWRESMHDERAADQNNQFDYTFVTLERN